MTIKIGLIAALLKTNDSQRSHFTLFPIIEQISTNNNVPPIWCLTGKGIPSTKTTCKLFLGNFDLRACLQSIYSLEGSI